MPAAKMLIAVVDMPRGPMTINDPNTDHPRIWATVDEARAELAGSQIVRAFGGELFEIGTGTPL